MVRRALFGLSMLIGVAAAQAPATWTFPSPRTAPDVEWSPNGSYVALSTNSGVYVFNNSLKLKWTKTTRGALPSLPNYAHPDRVHFSADSSSVWLRTGENGTYTEFNPETGAIIRTHTFSDWDGDYALTPMTDALLAVKITVSGGVETIKVRSYNKSTLDPILTGVEFTHTYVAGVDKPTVRFGTADYIGFYNKIINITTGATTNWDNAGAGTEVWTLGNDYSKYLIQQVMQNDGSGNYTRQAVRYQKAVNLTAWSNNNINLLGGPLGLRYSGGNWLGYTSNGTQLSVFNSQTGTQLYTTDLGNTGGSFTFSPTALNPYNYLLTTLTTAAGVQKLAYLGFNTTPNQTPVTPMNLGISGVGTIASGSRLATAAGNTNYTTQIETGNGALRWTSLSNVPVLEIAVSGNTGVAASTSGLTFFNNLTGAAITNWTGSYKHVAWVNSGQVIAVKPDGSADLVNFDGTTATAAGSIVARVFAGGVYVLSGGAYAIGVTADNKFDTAVNLSTKTYFTSPHSLAIKSLVPLDNNTYQIAFLNPTTGAVSWRRYQVNSDGSIGATTTPVGNTNVSSPYTVAPGFGFASTTTNSATNGIMAMFFSTGVGVDGTPNSELRLVRVSDNKVIGSWSNTYSYVRQLQFSPNGDILFVGTGGSSIDNVVMSNDSGPQDMLAYSVPTWIASLTAPTLNSGATGTGTFTLGHVGSTTVSLTVSPSGPTIPATITPSTSATSANFSIVAPAVSTDTVYTLSAKGTGVDETVTTTFKVLAPVPTSIVISPASVVGGNEATGTVTLSGVAPDGGTVVTLTSSASAASIPATVTIPAGSKSATFTVSTVPVYPYTQYTVKGTVGSTTVTSNTAAIGSTVPSTVTVTDTVIVSGNTSTGTVTLNTVAPKGGTVVNLASANPSVATVPATVTVAEGQKTADFTISTVTRTSDAQVRITAQTIGAVKVSSPLITVAATFPSSVNLTAASVIGGNNTTATVTLTTKAPAGGTVVHLTSASSNISIPDSVTVPAGATTSDPFTITTYSVSADATATITASTIGSVTASSTLTVSATPVSSVTFSPASVSAGAPSTGTVTIGGLAGSAGQTVTLATTGATAPTSVLIPAGQNSVTFPVTTAVSTSGSTATTTATIGASSKSGNLTITPTKVVSFILDNPSVTGGTSLTGKIKISGTALTGGFTVTLTTSNSSVVSVGSGTTSTTVTIPAGSDTANVTLTTAPVGTSTNVNLTATAPGTSGVVAVATVIPPKVVSIVFNPASVTGGTAASFTITLSGPAPAGFGVNVSSSDSHLVLSGLLKFNANQTSTSYTANTTTVTTATTATATATAGGGSATGTLTINPAS